MVKLLTMIHKIYTKLSVVDFRRLKVIPNNLKATLSSFTENTVLKSNRFASIVKSVPFELIEGPGLRLKQFNRPWKSCLWYTANVVVYAYAIFQALNFSLAIKSHGLATTKSALHVFYFTAYWTASLFFTCMLYDGSTYIAVVNGLNGLMLWSEGKGWCRRRWSSYPCSIITINYFCLILAGSLMMSTGLFISDPIAPRYFYSILPEKFRCRLEFLFLGILFEIIAIIWIASILMVNFCHWNILIFQQIFWLDDLCRVARGSGDADVQDWQDTLSFYRSLKCLNVLHNSYNRRSMSGYIVLITNVAVLYLYCSIKTYQILPLWLYVVFPLFAVFTMVLVVTMLPYIAKWERKSMDFRNLAMAKFRT